MNKSKSLSKFWKGKKVFLTGHTGFKGTWFSIFLNLLGAKVMGYSLKPNTAQNFYNLIKLNKLNHKSVIGDIRDYNKLKNFALEYPEQGAPLMDIMKTDSDIGKNNAPDAEALSSLGKNWNKMVNEGTTGRFKTFAEYVDANPTVAYPDKKLSETQSKTLDGYFTAASAAQVVAGRINQINALIGDKKMGGGGLVQLGADLQAYLNIDTPAADVNQVIKAIQTRGATLVRAPGSGSTSDLEFGAYKAVFPTLATTPDGRALMVTMANLSAERTADIADYAQKLYDEGKFSLRKIYEFDKQKGEILNDKIRKEAERLSGMKVTPYSDSRKAADKLFDLTG